LYICRRKGQKNKKKAAKNYYEKFRSYKTTVNISFNRKVLVEIRKEKGSYKHIKSKQP